MWARGFPPHSPQHRLIDMLQGNVDVARDLVAFCNRLDQFVAPMSRVCIKQSHPEFAFDLLNFAKQRGKSWSSRRINRLTGSRSLRPQVHSVIRCILTDQIDLERALADELPNLSENRFKGPAAVSSAHLRDHTETARVIAPFRDFYISRVPRRKSEARRVVIGNVRGARASQK